MESTWTSRIIIKLLVLPFSSGNRKAQRIFKRMHKKIKKASKECRIRSRKSRWNIVCVSKTRCMNKLYGCIIKHFYMSSIPYKWMMLSYPKGKSNIIFISTLKLKSMKISENFGGTMTWHHLRFSLNRFTLKPLNSKVVYYS